jgi:hypothetical protein
MQLQKSEALSKESKTPHLAPNGDAEQKDMIALRTGIPDTRSNTRMSAD